MNDDGHDEIKLVDAEEIVAIPVRYVTGGYELTIADKTLIVNGELEDEDRIVANIDGVRIVATVLLDDGGVTVIDAGHVHQIGIFDVLAAAEVDDAGTGGVVAPLPGKVVAVLTEAGASVDKGTPLMIVEAMKMEHTITAPADGVVDEIHFEIGDAVDEGTVLVAFSVAED
jgi:3-methylcrotonyl-CoA carboxylase alpha subunit